MQYSLPGLDQDVPGAKTMFMFTESNGDFLDRGWIKETENMTGRTPSRGRPTEKTVKLETCFEYLDTRDDYSALL